MAVDLTCARCGTPFSVSDTRAKTARYCGAECYNAARAESREARRVSKECETCGAAFDVPAHRKDAARYCSHPCSVDASRGERRVEYVVTACEQCGAMVERRPSERPRRFCSRPCAFEWNRGQAPTERTCKFCGWTGSADRFMRGQNTCKRCRSAYAKRMHERYARMATVPETKRCGGCGEVRPAADFHRKRGNTDGLAARCKECRQRRRRNRYASDTDTRARILRRNKRWRERNPLIVATMGRRAYVRRKEVEGEHTADDVERIWRRQGGRCVYCRTKLGRSPDETGAYHVDHIMPLAKGGTDNPDNLQCLCPPCNLRKRDKDPLEFANQMGLLF